MLLSPAPCYGDSTQGMHSQEERGILPIPAPNLGLQFHTRRGILFCLHCLAFPAPNHRPPFYPSPVRGWKLYFRGYRSIIQSPCSPIPQLSLRLEGPGGRGRHTSSQCPLRVRVSLQASQVPLWPPAPNIDPRILPRVKGGP